MGGGGGVQSPKQVTLAQSIGDIANTEGSVLSTELGFQPSYQTLGQRLSMGSLENFGGAMQNVINPSAYNNTAEQYAYNNALYAQNAPQAAQNILSNNPLIGQGINQSNQLINQGSYNQGQANSMIGSGQSLINQGSEGINKYLDMQNVIGSSGTLQGLNNTVNQNLSGNISPETIAQIAQGSGAAFSANGLFNSTDMAASNLLNQANYQQARQQQWANIGTNVAGQNIAQQQSLLGGAQALGGIGGQQQQIGSQLANYAGMQGEFGLGGLQNASSMLQSGIQSLISPNQYNANLQSLTSSFAPGQVTPQIIPQELGTASGLNEFNAQGQFAANAANAQMANQQNAAMMGLGGAGVAALGSILGGLAAGGVFCWLARECFGIANPKWKQFRKWMLDKSPIWLFKFYLKYGERIAEFIHDKPILKDAIKGAMQYAIV